MAFLEIDGSFGEGGGQILRIAASFSIIFGRPIRVTNVRAGRRVPGLRPQHAATLRILRDVCGGDLQGGEVGSTEITFSPGRPVSRTLSFDLGTAASMTLVMQALVPAISLSGASLGLELIGGTDVPWSPTCDYVSIVLAESLRRIGIEFSLDVVRRGYYPRGGGRGRVRIEPCSGIRPIAISSRGTIAPISVVSRVGMLPRKVAERQATSAASTLKGSGLSADTVSIFTEESSSPGTSVLVSTLSESCIIGSDSIGARGKPAERVGWEAATRFIETYNSGACIDSNLADMLAPLLCLASGPSSLLVPGMSEHMRTSLHVARQFAPAEVSTEARGEALLVNILPKPAK